MSNLLSAIGGKSKHELVPIELDAVIETIVAEYVGTYLRNRIYLASLQKQEISEDTGYIEVVNFLAMVNNEFNHMRMWSQADMTNTVWPSIAKNDAVLRFVFKGTTQVSVRAFSSDDQFHKLVEHISGSLSCMSHAGNEIMAEDLVAVLPRMDELRDLFVMNQWALFVYYLTRINIIDIITKPAGGDK